VKKKGELFNKITDIVKKIPPGEVATYGQIARMAGTKDARKAGWALSGNKDPKIPCHRIIRSDGEISTNYSKGNWLEQKRSLEFENVTFVSKTKVNLKKHLWQP
jgi:O-6-methylguanine DNA methyltransferase